MKTMTVLSLLPPPSLNGDSDGDGDRDGVFFSLSHPSPCKNVYNGDCSNDDVLNCGCLLTFFSSMGDMSDDAQSRSLCNIFLHLTLTVPVTYR